MLVVVLIGSCSVHSEPGRIDSKAPAVGADCPPDAASDQKRALANGLPVWVVEAHEVPLVQVNLVVFAGSGDDPAGQFGVASLAAAMLDEGAGLAARSTSPTPPSSSAPS